MRASGLVLWGWAFRLRLGGHQSWTLADNIYLACFYNADTVSILYLFELRSLCSKSSEPMSLKGFDGNHTLTLNSARWDQNELPFLDFQSDVH